jgi:hypothetical protein
VNNLIKVLLGGVALSILAAAPAASQQSYQSLLSVTALHEGRAVHKTRRYHCKFPHSSCTETASSNVPASDFGKKVMLLSTFYKFNNNGNLCSDPKTKIKAQKKTQYAKISTGTVTYYEGCKGAQPTFYGDFYKLTNKEGFGKADTFESMLTSTFHFSGHKYKGQLILFVNIAIGDETAENSN